MVVAVILLSFLVAFFAIDGIVVVPPFPYLPSLLSLLPSSSLRFPSLRPSPPCPCIDVFELGTNVGKKLGFFDGKVLGTTLEVADGITLGIDEGTELGSSDGSYDGSNEGKPEGSLIGS